MFELIVHKWKEANKNHKKSMGKFFVKNGILTNPKVAELTPIEFTLYMHCLCVASESSMERIRITSKSLPKQLRMGDKSLTNRLERLESLQLVTVEKRPLIKLNKSKLNEIKLKKNTSPNGEEKVSEKNLDKKDAAQKELIALASDLPSAQPTHPLLKIWNDYATGSLPKAKSMSSSRKKLAAALWKSEPSEAYWIEVMKKIQKSDFCKGSNDRGWVATFDWFLKPDTHLKIMEGKYDTRDKKGYYMTQGMKIAHNAKIIDQEIQEMFGGSDAKDVKPL